MWLSCFYVLSLCLCDPLRACFELCVYLSMSLCVSDFVLLRVIRMYACVICMCAFHARCRYVLRCMYVFVFETIVGCVRSDVGCTFVPVKCTRVHLSIADHVA